MVTAQTAWELAELSRGRFTRGLGTQLARHLQGRFGMPAEQTDHLGSRLEEYARALRAIFDSFQTGEPLQFTGRYWSFDLLPEPHNPGPIDHLDIPIHTTDERAALYDALALRLMFTRAPRQVRVEMTPRGGFGCVRGPTYPPGLTHTAILSLA